MQVNSAEPFTSADGPSVRIPVDVRRFPWIRRLAADYAFNQTALVRLEIVCAVDNLRSQRAAEKTGAVREGILRSRLVLRGKPTDAVMYGIARPV